MLTNDGYIPKFALVGGAEVLNDFVNYAAYPPLSTPTRQKSGQVFGQQTGVLNKT
jgi:hypothetical protein